jgi:hypothetical protein
MAIVPGLKGENKERNGKWRENLEEASINFIVPFFSTKEYMLGRPIINDAFKRARLIFSDTGFNYFHACETRRKTSPVLF